MIAMLAQSETLGVKQASTHVLNKVLAKTERNMDYNCSKNKVRFFSRNHGPRFSCLHLAFFALV